MKIKSLGSLPKNMQEIRNAKRSIKGGLTHEQQDQMFRLVEFCKDDCATDNPYFVSAPELMCVLATQQQLSDMKKFLTEEDNSVIMGVDSTFDLGRFLATIITYSHPLLNSQESGKSPVIIGPVLMHVSKAAETFEQFGKELTCLCPELKNVNWIGTDRERAIFQGLQKSMPRAGNILCTKHVRENIEMKLTKLGVGQMAKRAFCRNIFGDSENQRGLFHASNEVSFDEQLSALEKERAERELAAGKKKGGNFFEYFRRKVANDMKKCMIAPVRQQGGLLPTTLYYNNNNKSINSKIKREMQGRRCDWPTFVKTMKQITAKQQRNVDRAVSDKGPYTLKPNVKVLGASSVETSRLTEKERAAILRRFYHFEPICEMRESSPEELVEDESSDGSDEMATSPCQPLSVPYQALDLTPILYDKMWSQAAHLIKEKGSIVSAPHSCTPGWLRVRHS